MRWLMRFLWLVLSLALLAALGLAWYAWRTLPATSGQLKLAGLSAPVDIKRDGADVTHVLARTAPDAWRALGYVHAQERGWQLEFNRRVMRGELSAVLGQATLETDKLMRTLGIRQAAEAQWKTLPDDAREAMTAYSQGVNAFYVENSQALTPEFLILGIDPRPAAREGRYWDELDSMGWLLMMALDLGGNWGNEFARLSMLQVLDTEAMWQAMPPYPGEKPAATADLAKLYRELGVYRTGGATKAEALPAAPAVATSAGEAWRKRLSEDVVAWSRELGNVDGKGSNNWVVAGSHTVSGKPLLANDPHLGLSAPAIWYFARLQAPAVNGRPALEAIGATLPGLPFVVLGRTAQVAWGFTNTGPDVQDLFLEQINPANPGQYRVPAPEGQTAWADFTTRNETIAVKGQPDVTHVVRSTRHGPVLSDAQASHGQVLDTSRFVLALRWTALDPDNHNALSGLRANSARNLDELKASYRHFHSPMQNVVMADTSGNIHYKAAGKVPVRASNNDIRGIAPSPGWESRYDWTGFIPYDETPQDDGARGWIATANQRIHGADYPHFITQDWSPPWRQQRIEQLLQARPKHDMASMKALHGDQVSLATQLLLPHLRKTQSQHPLASAALAQLDGFDGNMRADRAAPLIYSAWVDEFTRGVIGVRIGKERFEAMYGKRLFRAGVEEILARDDKAWCGDAGCGPASTGALNRALDKLQAVHGGDVAKWRWGDAHPAISVHRPFSNVKPLARFFEVRVPTGGDPFTVNVGQYHLDKLDAPYANRHAASLRALYDMADPEKSLFIYQTGQSGNVFSGRYRDMSPGWASVQYRPLQLNPATWTSSLTLAP